MSARDDKGFTLREQLQGLLTRTRVEQKRQELEEQLAMPPFPAAVKYLWLAFWEIRPRRGGNGFGAVPVSWADLDSYCRLTGTRFAPWEVRILTALDDLWLAAMRAKQTSDEPPK